MPYRGRAVNRVKGQRKLKMNAPTAKFTITKDFEVTNGSAHSSVYMRRIQLASPFGVFHDVTNSSGSSLGTWEANDETNIPIGLNSELYKNYNYLVVKGTHVTCSVNEAPDVVIPTSGDGAKMTQTTGQITLARTADLISEDEIPTTATMKTWFGQKTKNFQLGTNIAGSRALTKNAYVSNGYSAGKQWNANPNAKFDLQVQNNADEEQDVDDPTHMYIIIKPRKDLDVSELPLYLKPLYVSVKVSYIIQFQDPTNKQSVPMPMSTGSRYAGNKQRVKRSTRSDIYARQADAGQVLAPLLGAMGLLGYGGYRRMGQRRNVAGLIGNRPEWVY